MARKSSVFTRTRETYMTLSIKIPKQLKDRVDGLKESLAAVDESLTFNVAKICQDALETAVKQGEVELTQLPSRSPDRTKANPLAVGDTKRS